MPRIVATIGERKLISQICDRAVDLYRRAGRYGESDLKFVRTATAVELMSVHEEIVPLRLADLLEADDFNLMHDVTGIHRHLSDDMTELKNCFCPRFANVNGKRAHG